jgi:hypothetical protein
VASMSSCDLSIDEPSDGRAGKSPTFASLPRAPKREIRVAIEAIQLIET